MHINALTERGRHQLYCHASGIVLVEAIVHIQYKPHAEWQRFYFSVCKLIIAAVCHLSA